MDRKEIVALVLAGGKGTRLKDLTRKNAKAAVYFGGKYRIIDFVLSNIANSGINNVGLVIQYESVELTNYVANGKIWGFDGNNSSFTILSPRQKEDSQDWFLGTADAVYQNLDFLEDLNPKYVLILSSDNIYKMNYSKMLKALIDADGDMAISTINVDLKEATRFGILETDENNVLLNFEEKPKKPKSTKASMGIYIFKYETLYDALVHDHKDKDSEHDFGYDIISYLLKKNKKIISYPFDGYWKDVGTIDSLYQSNMELVDDINLLDLYDYNDKFNIYSEDTRSLPSYVGKKAVIENSMVNQGSIILGEVYHSMIFGGVEIKEGAVVKDSIIMPNTVIKPNVTVKNAIVSRNLTISSDINNDEEARGVSLVSKDA